MNLLNSGHFYDTTLRHCANFMVQRYAAIASSANSAPLLKLDWCKRTDLISCTMLFNCTEGTTPIQDVINELVSAIEDHGKINHIDYLRLKATPLKKGRLCGIVVNTLIKPNYLVNTLNSPLADGENAHRVKLAEQRLAPR